MNNFNNEGNGGHDQGNENVILIERGGNNNPHEMATVNIKPQEIMEVSKDFFPSFFLVSIF